MRNFEDEKPSTTYDRLLLLLLLFLFLFFQCIHVLLFQQFVNLPPPYPTKCENKTLRLYSTYTIEGCLHECELEATERVCGCHLTSYPGLRILHSNVRLFFSRTWFPFLPTGTYLDFKVLTLNLKLLIMYFISTGQTDKRYCTTSDFYCRNKVSGK